MWMEYAAGEFGRRESAQNGISGIRVQKAGKAALKGDSRGAERVFPLNNCKTPFMCYKSAQKAGTRS